MRSNNIKLQINRQLREKNMTVAAAESCTGGLLSNYLTAYAGSSEYFLIGFVCYANEAKINLLKIKPSIIKRHGAVSKEVAGILCENVKKIAGSDIGISVTGIAGPGGGHPGKPVGLVYIGIAVAGKHTRVHEYKFKGTRSRIKKLSSLKAIEELLKEINA